MKIVKVVKTEIGKLLACWSRIRIENPRQAERRAAFIQLVKLAKKGRKA